MRTSFLINLVSAYLTSAQIDASTTARVIERDVAIIGGGPSGTYAAVNLRDRGASVVVVEKHADLGGNVDSYRVPGSSSSSTSVEFGVQALVDAPTLRKFFSRFNVTLTPASFPPPGQTVYADFSRGSNLSSFAPPTPNFDVYFQQRDKYPYLDSGIRLPTPVPADLYLPFGEFVTKYRLEKEVFALYTVGHGLGDLLSIPTLNVFKYLSRGLLAIYLPPNPNAPAALVPQGVDIQEVFRRAQKFLARDLFLNSTVTSASRSSTSAGGGVTLQITTPSGPQTIKAKKLLISARPTPSNLQPFHLDDRESAIIKRFTSVTGWYVALVSHTGLTPGTTYINASPNQPYNLSSLPSIYSIAPTRSSGLFWIQYGSTTLLSDEQVQADIIKTIIRLRPLAASSYSSSSSSSGDPKIVAYASHSPFQLTVSPDAIEGGFYNALDKLQGYRNTFYTGITFTAPSFTAVLNLTEDVVSRLL